MMDDHGDQGKFDPSCSQFDPLAALHATNVPGLASVTPLRNLQQFEEYQENPQLFMHLQSKQEEKEKMKRAIKEKEKLGSMEAQTSVRKPHQIKNVLTRMQRIEGPSALLQQWVQSRIRVKVVTRSFKCIRGTCTGFIVAFDKYLNLAMVDVDETYASIHKDTNSIKSKRRRRGKEGPKLPPDQKSQDNLPEQVTLPADSMNRTDDTHTASPSVITTTPNTDKTTASESNSLTADITSKDLATTATGSTDSESQTDNVSNTMCDTAAEQLSNEVASHEGILSIGAAPRQIAGEEVPKSKEADLVAARVESLKLTPSNNIKHRHIRQLLLRGDNVVSISACL